jgi:competence protein ComGC
METYQNLSSEEKEYIESLNPKQKKAYNIAKDHLGSSFDLIKSNGLIEWKKTKSLAPQTSS